MSIIEATIAFLFRPTVDPHKAERQRQKTCMILRNITDPAESVAECLTDKPEAAHDATTQATPTHGR